MIPLSYAQRRLWFVDRFEGPSPTYNGAFALRLTGDLSVGVLESAGLIDREVRGREHWLSVRSAGLALAEEWIADQVSFWSVRADALAARLERRKRQP